MFGMTERAAAMYRMLLRNRNASIPDLARARGVSPATVRKDVAELARRGLVTRDESSPSGFQPTRPTTVLENAVAAADAELASRTAELRAQRQFLTTLTEDYLAGLELAGPAVELVRLDGLPAVRAWMDRAVARTRDEMLAVVTAFEDDQDAVDAARDEDLAMLTRGVRVRTIYPTTIRDMPVTWAYAMETVAAGEEIRLTDELPTRMVVLDREIAVIPIDAENLELGAVVVHCKPVVGTFVALFELAWGHAIPAFTSAGALAERDRPLLDLLAAGAKDDTIARHLHRDVRTVRRDIARLMGCLGAATRFQAGIEVARRSWV